MHLIQKIAKSVS